MSHQKGGELGAGPKLARISRGWTGRCLEKDSEADCEREGTEGYWRILAQALKIGTTWIEWPRSINSWAMSVKMALLKRRARGSR